jgi:uncharacterized protein (UPF0297 family)
MNKRELFRKKRIDTKMDIIQKKYGKDFGMHSNEQLYNYLEKKGYNSLNKLLKLKVA